MLAILNFINHQTAPWVSCVPVLELPALVKILTSHCMKLFIILLLLAIMCLIHQQYYIATQLI